MKNTLMNRVKNILGIFLVICLMLSLSIPSMAVVSDTDVSSLTEAQQAVIQKATNDFYAAKASGDTAGMLEAHHVAEAVRNSAGYSGGSNGSDGIPLANVVTLQFPAGEGATDRDRTLSSLTAVDGEKGLYMMTYYGDYSDVIENKNKEWIKSFTDPVPTGCSLISLTGDKDHPVYGRNFDNPPGTGAILTIYRPADKYASIAFSRTLDFALAGNFTVDSLDDTQKDALLAAPFYVPCGMNEKGVAVALAYNPPGESTDDLDGNQVFVTDWIREVLDNAQDVDEAVAICKGLRPFDMAVNTVTHHLLIADAEGNSIIAEVSGGKWQFWKNENQNYQVVTNTPLYNVSEAERDANCWRYKTASSMLSEMNGTGTWKDALSVLKAVKQNKTTSQTIWSFSADLSTQTMYFCMYGDFSTIYKVTF